MPITLLKGKQWSKGSRRPNLGFAVGDGGCASSKQVYRNLPVIIHYLELKPNASGGARGTFDDELAGRGASRRIAY